jgi:hypothetical protein
MSTVSERCDRIEPPRGAAHTALIAADVPNANRLETSLRCTAAYRRRLSNEAGPTPSSPLLDLLTSREPRPVADVRCDRVTGWPAGATPMDRAMFAEDRRSRCSPSKVGSSAVWERFTASPGNGSGTMQCRSRSALGLPALDRSSSCPATLARATARSTRPAAGAAIRSSQDRYADSALRRRQGVRYPYPSHAAEDPMVLGDDGVRRWEPAASSCAGGACRQRMLDLVDSAGPRRACTGAQSTRTGIRSGRSRRYQTSAGTIPGFDSSTSTATGAPRVWLRFPTELPIGHAARVSRQAQAGRPAVRPVAPRAGQQPERAGSRGRWIRASR